MTIHLNKLPAVGKTKKRIGRGIAGGGAKSGRGMKGQRSRAGYSGRAGFEGGQTPLYQRLPKARGSKQIFASQVKKPAVITLGTLNKFTNGTIVGPGALVKMNLISKRAHEVKLVNSGKLESKITVRIHKITEQAQKAVEAAGGKVEIIKSEIE